ncbi:uroporphyrinogen-III synthase [Paenibacillus sp. SC116]|uniref:uroporphyrinogen-III synthase n=1 Tax=Paenibacillus sp. SC116 TaxID=2968986 RepID=UPI00215A7D96|nr:uroporphyrinogen-III synthase [Paenibacillus sp. SC116]MCR8844078.1 uroporphyrinogen-III synthase [Paenibacillus sp. SC116]
MAKLAGKTIVLTGPRKAEEMATIVMKQGGTPLIRPTQGTVYAQFEHLDQEVDKLLHTPFTWAIWTTGIGINTLMEAAEASGKAEALKERLKELRHAARGYKTMNALKRLGIVPEVRDDDGSTAGLIRALQEYGAEHFKGETVSLQLHGDPAPALVAFFEEAQASYSELMPYRHTPPEPEVMKQLLDEIIQGQVDAVVMTSAPQPRFLFEYAREQGLEKELLQQFASSTLAAAVGKVTAGVLRDEGVERILVPQEERMGALIVRLAQWYDGQHEESVD